MAPSRSRRLREPAGTSATGDAKDFCGFRGGKVPSRALPQSLLVLQGKFTSIDLFWLLKKLRIKIRPGSFGLNCVSGGSGRGSPFYIQLLPLFGPSKFANPVAKIWKSWSRQDPGGSRICKFGGSKLGNPEDFGQFLVFLISQLGSCCGNNRM